MRTITEGTVQQEPPETPYFDAQTPGPYTPSINVQTPSGNDPVSRVATGASAMNSAGNAAQRARGLRRYRSGAAMGGQQSQPAADEYDNDVVDLLDLVGT